MSWTIPDEYINGKRNFSALTIRKPNKSIYFRLKRKIRELRFELGMWLIR